MKPLFVLLGVFGLSCLLTWFSGGQVALLLSGRRAMAAMLVFTSVAHFVFWRGMALMLPKALPNKKAIVYGTGVLEVIAGIGLLIPAATNIMAILLVAFFVLILPGNIKAAREHVNLERADYTGNGLSYLWFRIPLQVLFITWTWYFGIYLAY
ncbi:hypothetical protein ABDD95_05110 [Mucilaginibacter sp. PAMB04274]|uniref:DoxX family protein n=1 Tax=Mucilaginibacter sp. PAMB04274 TaxID=3138568 RepID=UPI0031F5FF6E